MSPPERLQDPTAPLHPGREIAMRSDSGALMAHHVASVVERTNTEGEIRPSSQRGSRARTSGRDSTRGGAFRRGGYALGLSPPQMGPPPPPSLMRELSSRLRPKRRVPRPTQGELTWQGIRSSSTWISVRRGLD